MEQFAPWKSYENAELDRQYSPSIRVESLDAYLEDYARLSADARSDCRAKLGLSFSGTPGDRLDYFPASSQKAPLVLFIHGGNWQALSRAESAFVAQAVRLAGAAYAAIDYGLAPHTQLESMVGAIRRCLGWLIDHADSLGHSAERIHIAGSSAGAHLAAMAVLTSESFQDSIAGCVLMSGIYDLEPIRHTYVNHALGLDAIRARALSPIHHLRSSVPPVVIACGENETEEYRRQHHAMVGSLQSRGGHVWDVIELQRNHFDLPYDLVSERSRLGRAVLRQIHGYATSTEA